MKSAKYIFVSIAVVALFTYLITGINFSREKRVLGGSVNYASSQAAATSTAVTVGTGSTLVQATTTRNACIISNDSNKAIYLSFTGGAATANTGVILQASSTLTLSNEFATGYYGAIFGISPGGNANVTAVCF